MKDFELRYVGSHVEVYTGSGVFLFSADTVREAMEELERGAGTQFDPELVPMFCRMIREGRITPIVDEEHPENGGE